MNLIVGPLAWSILARLALVKEHRNKALAAFLVAALATTATALWPTISVYVLAAVEVIAIVPQLIEVFKPIDLSGVSITTWLATTLAQGLWGVYGFVAHQTAVSLGGFAGAALAIVIAVRLWHLSRTSPPPTP